MRTSSRRMPGNLADSGETSSRPSPLNITRNVGKMDQCAYALLSRPPGQISSVLTVVADILLAEPERTASVTYIGGILSLSDIARQLLEVEGVRLGRMLRCYASHFRLHGNGSNVFVTYLGDSSTVRWKFSYDVYISV
eukprot:TRINITY_DN8329_c0_g1_i1.p1 TRINITY_DN8329_c0_g1~~TRINITY_DN8329_c0_g1_i1.p1  ORF type:complete len:138 (+),score=17.15 TRINITY_DN8329_c0_g1_i1:289-702(+)